MPTLLFPSCEDEENKDYWNIEFWNYQPNQINICIEDSVKNKIVINTILYKADVIFLRDFLNSVLNRQE